MSQKVINSVVFEGFAEIYRVNNGILSVERRGLCCLVGLNIDVWACMFSSPDVVYNTSM